MPFTHYHSHTPHAFLLLPHCASLLLPILSLPALSLQPLSSVCLLAETHRREMSTEGKKVERKIWKAVVVAREGKAEVGRRGKEERHRRHWWCPCYCYAQGTCPTCLTVVIVLLGTNKRHTLLCVVSPVCVVVAQRCSAGEMVQCTFPLPLHRITGCTCFL